MGTRERVVAPTGVRPDLEAVFRARYRHVVGVATRVLGSRHEAEDVAQEVFVSFGRSQVPAGEAVGWLSVAAVHLALNHRRGGRRRIAREDAVVDRRAVAPDVADTVAARADHERVRGALARLPRRQAVALVLRHSGLGYAEIASALDLSTGSIGTTIRRAEAALLQELHRDDPSE